VLDAGVSSPTHVEPVAAKYSFLDWLRHRPRGISPDGLIPVIEDIRHLVTAAAR